MNFKELNY